MDRAVLEAGREEAAREVADGPWSHVLERLGRTQLWLDEIAEGRRRLREAAEAAERDCDAHGRQDALSFGHAGTLWWLAGEREVAAGWFGRALEVTRARENSGGAPQDVIVDMSAYLYLLDDPGAALAARERLTERWPLEFVEGLARARLENDPLWALEAREHAVVSIRAERVPPYEESGSPHLSLFDWLEETFVVEAQLRGEDVPNHATMLERAGLVSPEEGRRRARRVPMDSPPQPGRTTLERTTPDGAVVQAAIETSELGDIALRLDPREGIELSVLLLKQSGEFLIRVEWGDDEEGWREEDLETDPGFRSACTTAADWLRAYAPNPPGGAWAAETIEALVATVSV